MSCSVQVVQQHTACEHTHPTLHSPTPDCIYELVMMAKVQRFATAGVAAVDVAIQCYAPTGEEYRCGNNRYKVYEWGTAAPNVDAIDAPVDPVYGHLSGIVVWCGVV